MVNESGTTGPAKPKMAERMLLVSHEFLEKIQSMEERLIDLEKKSESQQKKIFSLTNQQYRTAWDVEDIKTGLRARSEAEPNEFIEDYIHNAEIRRDRTDSVSSTDSYYSALENEPIPSTSKYSNQETQTTEDTTTIQKDAMTQTENEWLHRVPELAEQINNTIENIENRARNVMECILPHSMDYDTVRTLLSIASQKNMVVKHFHKKWNNEISVCLQKNQFKRSLADPHLYVKFDRESAVYWIHNDFLIAARNIKQIDEIASFLEEFDIEDHGVLKNFQGMEIQRNDLGFFHVKQSIYINNLLKLLGIKDALIVSRTPMSPKYLKNRLQQQAITFQQAIVLLSEIAMKSRPDIAVPVTILNQCNGPPTQYDWEAVKKVALYLKATIDSELRLGQENPTPGLIGYADANFVFGQKSNSGYVFYFYGSPISWACEKQADAAKSTRDAEFIALETATRKGLWLQSLIQDLVAEEMEIPIIYEDNKDCLKLIKLDKFDDRNSINMSFDISKITNEKIIIFLYCRSMDNTADMLTKPLARYELRRLAEKCGLVFFNEKLEAVTDELTPQCSLQCLYGEEEIA